jgi:membrane AbrB-like protein
MIGWPVALLLVGLAGGLVAHRTKMPGGTLLGAMLATAALSLAAPGSPPLPESLRSLALVLLGIHAGSSVDRLVLARVRRVLPVAWGMMLLLIGTSVVLGWLLYSRSGRDVRPATVMLGIMPGGASGLAAAAYNLGADAPTVASLHMMRQIIVFGLLPLLVRWLAGLSRRSGDDGQATRR